MSDIENPQENAGDVTPDENIVTGQETPSDSQTPTVSQSDIVGAYSLESLGYGQGDNDTAPPPVVKKKPRGRPRKAETTAQDAQTATLSPTAPKSASEKKAIRMGCDQTARAILGTAVGAMRELVGEEWNFQSQEEADGMRVALAAYLEAKGGGEMSPEMALLLMTSGYVAPRFGHQNTRDKFGAFFGKVGGWFKSTFKALSGH